MIFDTELYRKMFQRYTAKDSSHASKGQSARTPLHLIQKLKDTPVRAKMTSESATRPKYPKEVDLLSQSESLSKAEEEVLYTFYTKDEDLRTAGTSICQQAVKKKGSEDIEKTAGSGTFSQVLKQLLHRPNFFSRTKPAMQWMLDVYGKDLALLPTELDINDMMDAHGRLGDYDEGIYGYGQVRIGGKAIKRPRKNAKIIENTQEGDFYIGHGTHRKSEKFFNIYGKTGARSRQPGKSEKFFDIYGKTGARDPRLVESLQQSKFSADFEWKELYPVVRTTSKFLVDKTEFLQTKPLPLPPIKPVTRQRSRNYHSEELKQHNIIHVKLPKLPA